MHNTRWQNNYTTETDTLCFLLLWAGTWGVRQKPSVAAWDPTSQPGQYFFWQGTGCSDSKTYASKILSLRFPSSFALSPQLRSLLIFLRHCIHVAAGGQSLQAAALKWHFGADAPTGAGTAALCASGSWRVWGRGLNPWTLALSRARCSRLRGSRGWAGSAGRCCPPWLR